MPPVPTSQNAQLIPCPPSLPLATCRPAPLRPWPQPSSPWPPCADPPRPPVMTPSYHMCHPPGRQDCVYRLPRHLPPSSFLHASPPSISSTEFPVDSSALAHRPSSQPPRVVPSVSKPCLSPLPPPPRPRCPSSPVNPANPMTLRTMAVRQDVPGRFSRRRHWAACLTARVRSLSWPRVSTFTQRTPRVSSCTSPRCVS